MGEFQEQGNHQGSLLLCYVVDLSVYGMVGVIYMRRLSFLKVGSLCSRRESL